MKKLLIILVFVTNLFAVEFSIEKDEVFSALISEFQSETQNVLLYKESENYRFDLSLIDLVDKVNFQLHKNNYQKELMKLNSVLDNNILNFYEWYVKLKEISKQNEDIFKLLDNKLFLQLYARNGLAILPEYKFIDFQKLKDLGLLRRIQQYNKLLSDPEASGINSAFSLQNHIPFIQSSLTVEKLRLVKRRTLRKLRNAYYDEYIEVLRRSVNVDYANKKVLRTKFRRTNKGVKATSEAAPEGVTGLRSLKFGTKVFNVIHSIPSKHNFITELSIDLAEKDIKVPRNSGHSVLTPYFIENNWKDIEPFMRGYTLNQYINPEDDEYLYTVRTWIKRNSDLIINTQDSYNKSNVKKVSLEFKINRRPKRLQTINMYEDLEVLFPDRPWIKDQTPDLYDRRGKAQYFSETSGQRFGRKFRSLLRSLVKVENYTSLLSGSIVMIATGGNVALGLSTRSLIKDAIKTIKFDKEWREFLLNAPAEIVNAFLLGSGFSAGRLYKIIAMGALKGSFQSYITGQDIRTGAIVGAGLSLIETYVLPYALSKPMSSGIDSKSLKMNRWLEITEKTVKSSLQGTIVATLTGDDILGGALKGAIYGGVSSTLTIWFLGTRYAPFKDYSDEEIDEMIALENNYQNEVGRGHFAIDRQLILDTNFRTAGVLPKMISASITLPGNVSMSDGGFSRLTTLTHEAHHLMQQEQSGLFGFYLFRYLPASFTHGYHGHPDENFLRDVLGRI